MKSEIVKIEIELNTKLSLKEQLDKIDDIIKQAAWDGYFWSRLNILVGKWEKGNVIEKSCHFRGGKLTTSWNQIAQETGKRNVSLKRWYDLYKQYPNRKEYIEKYAKPKAEKWTKEALASSVHFLSESSEWTTPEIIINKTIELFGEIDLDPCSNPDFPNVLAKNHFTKKEDGLSKDWHGKIYMNPPYGNEIKNWINHLYKQFEKGNIEEAIALTPSRTDTKWFQEMKNFPRCFIWGRLKFGESGNSAPFPSMVVYLGKNINKFINIFSDIGDIYKLRIND